MKLLFVIIYLFDVEFLLLIVESYIFYNEFIIFIYVFVY